MMFIPYGQSNSMNLSFTNNFEKINLQSNAFYNNAKPNELINEYDGNLVKKRKIRNKFTPEEDQKLRELIQKHGDRSWNLVSRLMGTRSQRQCRERWKHYLSCDMSMASKPWTKEEDEILISKFNELGAKWTKIARELPGRSDLQVKLRYMKHLRNKKNRTKYANDESESSDEFYPDDDDDGKENDLNKNAQTDIRKQNNEKQEQNQQSFTADTIHSETNFTENANNIGDDLGFSLDLDMTSSNILEELCKCDECSFLDQWTIMTL